MSNAELRRLAHGAHRPQAVLAKARDRIADRADQPLRQIAAAVERIGDGVGQRIVGDRVHREVPPREILGQRLHVRHRRRAAAVQVRPLPAKRGHLHVARRRGVGEHRDRAVLEAGRAPRSSCRTAPSPPPGTASVATSKSAGGRPSSMSRTPPPTRCASCPAPRSRRQTASTSAGIARVHRRSLTPSPSPRARSPPARPPPRPARPPSSTGRPRARTGARQRQRHLEPLVVVGTVLGDHLVDGRRLPQRLRALLQARLVVELRVRIHVFERAPRTAAPRPRRRRRTRRRCRSRPSAPPARSRGSTDATGRRCAPRPCRAG